MGVEHGKASRCLGGVLGQFKMFFAPELEAWGKMTRTEKPLSLGEKELSRWIKRRRLSQAQRQKSHRNMLSSAADGHRTGNEAENCNLRSH